MSFLYTWGTWKFLCIIGMVKGTPELWEWSSSSLLAVRDRMLVAFVNTPTSAFTVSFSVAELLPYSFSPVGDTQLGVQSGFWVTVSKAGGIPLSIQMCSGKNRWSPCRNATSSLQCWEVQPAQLQWVLFVPGWLHPSLAFGSRSKLCKPLQ